MSYLELRTWDPVLSGKSQLPCSQWWKLQPQLTWDLQLGTPCEPALRGLLQTHLVVNASRLILSDS